MKVSIIIRAYNSQNTIARAVRSALRQVYKGEFEVVVVNDGSTDNTMDILRSFQGEPNVRVIDQKNQGATAAAHTGFANARGEYIVLLDDDDCFEPNLLMELSGILDKNPHYAFAYSDYYEEYNGEKNIVKPKNVLETIAGGVMYRKDMLAQEGFWRREILFPEYDLLLRTITKWQGGYCDKALFTYSRSKESLTGAYGWVKKAIAELKVLHKDKIDRIKMIRDYTF